MSAQRVKRMEMSQIALNQGLTFLAWATGIVVIVVAGFLVKLLFDLQLLLIQN